MSIELIGQLKALKLHGMAQSWPELMARARHHSLDAEQVMQELLAAETAEREVKSLAYQMKAARFPAHRDLAGFDFAQSQVDATLVRRLHEGTFMDSAQNVVLIGGPGTGKTHLATAIGVEAIQRHHRRVRFLSTVELVNALELELSNVTCSAVIPDHCLTDEAGGTTEIPVFPCPAASTLATYVME
jgi:DNA replication protein DnaC